MSILSRAAILAFGTAALLSQACTLASPTTVKYEPAEETDATEDGQTDGSKTDAKSTPAGGGGDTCTGGKFTKPDLSKLVACGEGKGHCYPKNRTGFGADEFTACEKAGDVCVPDNVLQAGGTPLKACKFLGGDPGWCATIKLYPTMDKRGGKILKQDACDEGQVCAPCVNPEDGVDTTQCTTAGVKELECSGGSGGDTNQPAPKPAGPAEECCGGEGTCMPMTGDLASKMVPDSCTGGKMCAPKSLAGGAAVKCNAGLIAGKGVCMGHCFNSMLETFSFALKQDVCKDTESCIPCSAANKMAGLTVPGCE